MGYFAYCTQPHKAFNYLDQGTEAVCQKIAVNYFQKEVRKRKLDGFKILDYMDEMLIEANPKDADKIGELLCESYTYASNQVWEWHKEHSRWFSHITFPFDLNGGYKVGKNYYECH